MGANDLAAVVQTSGRTDATQDFTNSRRLLTQAVDKFMGRKLRSAALNKLDSYNMTRGSGMGTSVADPEQAERLYKAESGPADHREPRRLAGGHPRPAEGCRVLQ